MWLVKKGAISLEMVQEVTNNPGKAIVLEHGDIPYILREPEPFEPVHDLGCEGL